MGILFPRKILSKRLWKKIIILIIICLLFPWILNNFLSLSTSQKLWWLSTLGRYDDTAIFLEQVKAITLKEINCEGLLSGDKNVTHVNRYYIKDQFNPFENKDDIIAHLSENCSKYKQMRSYPTHANSEEEAGFPIAYSILVHKEASQVEMLLQAIYWPQNYYCIHVDKKISGSLFRFIRNLSNCFPNVILPSKRQDVVYAGYSRLQADLNCMEDLLKKNRTWKYLINLTGQEFPLKTNLELVQILKIYNGANDIEAVPQEKMTRLKQRWTNSFVERNRKVHKVTNRKKDPPPKGITIVKGSAYGVFSRAYIEFIMREPTVQEFLFWLRDVFSPDEILWATTNSLYYNKFLNTPGGFEGPPADKPWLAKYASWSPKDPCYHRHTVHYVCIFSAGDLPVLTYREELFANKFYVDYDYSVLYCLDNWLRKKNQGKIPLVDMSYYKELSFVII